jgi:hypothetical protein
MSTTIQTRGDYREQLIESIKNLDIDGVSDEVGDPISNIIEEQKVYFWIRLYINDELNDILQGDDITIKWTPSGEELTTKFICFGKNGLERDHDDQVTNWNPEDDKKILCLMVDERVINLSDEIPFIRTLFKTGRHYEYQLVKREELIFVNKRNSMILDYFDCDF